MYSPLEQFQIQNLINISFSHPLDLSLTNSTLSLIICGLVWLVISNSQKNLKLIPNSYQIGLEFYYKFLLNLTNEHLGVNSPLFSLIFTIFTLIGIINLLGFTPFVFTATTHLIIALGISISLWFSVILIGLNNHKLNFLSAFMPSGTPIILGFLLVPIELLSFTARAFSLGLRLCINVSTGHLLQLIIAEFGYKFLVASVNQNNIFLKISISLAALIPMFVLFALSFLELGILIMQSFVFTTLTAIYISESIELH